VNAFRSMGCEVVCSDGVPIDAVHALFDSRDRRFSRFQESSELNRVNANPRGVTLVSEELASMLALLIDAAKATDGLVSPAVGGAVLAAGYDRDFVELPADGDAVEPVRVPAGDSIVLRDRLLLRVEPVVLDLNGIVKARTVDDALAVTGAGWISAGGDLATTIPVTVGLPGGDVVELRRGGLATSSTGKRAWLRGGEQQHHLIDPRTGAPARSPWRDVSVVAATCATADVAAKAALLLGDAGPDWLDERRLAGRFVAESGAVVRNGAWRDRLERTSLAA
jgi:thiamine biosynthesis lipoprotein